MKSTLYILTLCLTLGACCKHEKLAQDLCVEPNLNSGTCVTDTAQIKALIAGKWNWTQQINSWTQAKTNPCTEQKNYSYEFFDNGTVKYYENGNYTYSGIYSFSQSQGITIQLQINAANQVYETGWVSVCNNYLVIDNSPVDGPKGIFIRSE